MDSQYVSSGASSSSESDHLSEGSNGEEEMKIMEAQMRLEVEGANHNTRLVPRVLLHWSSSVVPQQPSTPPGYHPDVTVRYAEAHCWVSYGSLLSMLRQMMLAHFKDDTSVALLRLQLQDLMRTPCPFSSTSRFPVGEVYACLDRLPLGGVVSKLMEAMAKSMVSSFDNSHIMAYHKAIREAIRLLSIDAEGPFPLLYSRDIFESAFLLQWID
ncbi:PREDICTED: uncharacterized protein LOC104585844 [Nelumbo nucifera]|uniref:Uncharacterized protein LOC104585844 n=2 Tax=Nelumbo nucifera TaxID=4432 RepID=A0A1U7YTT6_NELNU|nr:PREDICTED: uncharacterized protein LOC104585844 [Nelumbo nucifera]XP_010241153.1 PREDICTED: uncharacterized protein LOC104585844 [Nelumbo nucifera]DAD23869.1 TPA_asm: hypothetical protein HUJ06_025332 [Nelumbo nucifera]